MRIFIKSPSIRKRRPNYFTAKDTETAEKNKVTRISSFDPSIIKNRKSSHERNVKK